MLLVLCGRKVNKLGGQDRRWLKVASMLCENNLSKVIINSSYYNLGIKTEIGVSDKWICINEATNKYLNYLKLNISIIINSLNDKHIHFSGSSLEMTPSALIIFLMNKKISFSFNGVSVDYLKKTGQWKSVLLLNIMNAISTKIEILNYTVAKENFFNKNKIFISDAMYAGNKIQTSRIKNPNKIIFAGHLYGIKGIDLLNNIILTRPSDDYEFHIFGEKPSSNDGNVNHIIHNLSSLKNVYFKNHHDDMSKAYCDAAVVLSLQTISNFPSQVVLEGLANGCSVVITNTGDSNRFGSGPGIFYIPNSFEKETYWSSIHQAALFSTKSQETIANYCHSKFSINNYVSNFSKNMEIIK